MRDGPFALRQIGVPVERKDEDQSFSTDINTHSLRSFEVVKGARLPTYFQSSARIRSPSAGVTRRFLLYRLQWQNGEAGARAG
jgi:hypothetical protein